MSFFRSTSLVFAVTADELQIRPPGKSLAIFSGAAHLSSGSSSAVLSGSDLASSSRKSRIIPDFCIRRPLARCALTIRASVSKAESGSSMLVSLFLLAVREEARRDPRVGQWWSRGLSGVANKTRHTNRTTRNSTLCRRCDVRDLASGSRWDSPQTHLKGSADSQARLPDETPPVNAGDVSTVVLYDRRTRSLFR